MRKDNKSTAIQVFDFFSGCGGTSCGFQSAGMNIKFALDHDSHSKASFEANFPNTHFEHADISKVNVNTIQKLIANKQSGPVLFSGCAPCQPFSNQNKKRLKLSQDKRVPLLARFANLVKHCRPDLVFVENVPGLQKLAADSQPFGDFVNTLNNAGYKLDYRPVKLANYGIPQKRRRLVLIGSLHGKVQLPEKTHGPGAPYEKYSTVRDWIGHLPPIKAGEEHQNIPNHRAAGLSALNLKRIMATPEGGGNRDWSEELILKCHKGFSGYSDVYGRMSWDAPASVLTTKCTSYSNGRYGHPEQHRAISIREAACLQTFPNDFIFRGNMVSMSRQIGNAVPVNFAKIIGHQFIDHLYDVGRLS